MTTQSQIDANRHCPERRPQLYPMQSEPKLRIDSRKSDRVRNKPNSGSTRDCYQRCTISSAKNPTASVYSAKSALLLFQSRLVW